MIDVESFVRWDLAHCGPHGGLLRLAGVDLGKVEFSRFLAGLLTSISRQVRPSTMIRVFRSVGMDPY